MPTIYTKYITLPNGKTIYAENYGKEAFKFDVTEKEQKEYKENNDN